MVALLPLQVRVVPHQLVQTATESEQHQRVDEEELDDVDDHPAERDLQRPQVRIDRENMDELEEGEDHAGGKGSLRQQHRIEGVPLLAREMRIQSGPLVPAHHVPGGEAQRDPHEEERVRDAVHNVPQVGNVLEQSPVPQRANLCPDQTQHVDDDEALAEAGKGAPLVSIPLVENGEQPGRADEFQDEMFKPLRGHSEEH